MNWKVTVMTRSIAFAAGADAANKNMRKYHRTVWDCDDSNIGAETFLRLWPYDSAPEGDSSEPVNTPHPAH